MQSNVDRVASLEREGSKPMLIELPHLKVYHFFTMPHNSGRVLWYHIGCPCVCPSVIIFSFNVNNLSKCLWVFTKLGMCIVDFWWSYLPETSPYFLFRTVTRVKCQWKFTKFGICIDIVVIQGFIQVFWEKAPGQKLGKIIDKTPKLGTQFHLRNARIMKFCSA